MMTRIILFTISLFFFVGCGQDPEANEPAEKTTEKEALLSTEIINNPATGKETSSDDAFESPEFVFDHLLHNFGTINEGDIVEHIYHFTNAGQTPIVITDVKATCGCTVPFFPKEPIEPGAEDFIKISFNSTKKPGHQEKSITIFANTYPNRVKLHFTADVIPKEE